WHGGGFQSLFRSATKDPFVTGPARYWHPFGFDHILVPQSRPPVALLSSPPLAGLASPCLFTSLPGVLRFLARDVFCLPPAPLAPALAEFALPLLSCFRGSSGAPFGAGSDAGVCRPIAVTPAWAEWALLLLSCFPTSSAAIFGVGSDADVCWPIAITRTWAEWALPLLSC